MVFNSDTTKSGVVTSPGYPNPYQARVRCNYDFQGRGKERVQIVFQDFNLYHSTESTKEWVIWSFIKNLELLEDHSLFYFKTSFRLNIPKIKSQIFKL